MPIFIELLTLSCSLCILLNNRDTRKLTALLYLNHPTWEPTLGGEFRLWYDDESTGEEKIVDIAPKGGRMIVFFSDSLVHAVMPTGIRTSDGRCLFVLMQCGCYLFLCHCWPIFNGLDHFWACSNLFMFHLFIFIQHYTTTTINRPPLRVDGVVADGERCG